MAAPVDPQVSLGTRLERGEVVVFEPCPFALPRGEDLQFLLTQRPGGTVHKDISFNPARNTISGFRPVSSGQAARLRDTLADFARNASGWLGGLLPNYAASWLADRVSFRPEEEATRRLRRIARNDLLHFDAFPSRPTRGRRILRLFVNIHPIDPRVWAVSETFPTVFARYAARVGRPGRTAGAWPFRFGHGLLNLFQPGARERTTYDTFMLRLHHFLKTCDEFQERSPRRLQRFPPGAAWLLFTDAVSHADLRGQFALEHSFFIAQDALVLPHESPLALLTRASGTDLLPEVASAG